MSRLLKWTTVTAILFMTSCDVPTNRELVQSLKAKVDAGTATEQEAQLYEKILQQQPAQQQPAQQQPAQQQPKAIVDGSATQKQPEIAPGKSQPSAAEPSGTAGNRVAGHPFKSGPRMSRTTGGAQIQGACSLTGDIKSFEVKSNKDIKSIQFGNFTSGTGLNLSLGGVDTQIDKIDSRTLKGSASGHSVLHFTIHHTDGTSSDITVR